jgi:hypothetical protein
MKRLYLLLLVLCLPLLCGQETYIPESGGGRTFYDVGSGNTLILPGFQPRGIVDRSAIQPYIDGTYCLMDWEQVFPLACSALSVTTNHYGYIPLPSGYEVFVDTCTVSVSSLAGWNDGDTDSLTIQLVVIDIPHTALTTLGDAFKIVDIATGCGTDPNCTTTVGVFEWQVDGTVSGSTADVAAAVDDGIIAINISGGSDTGNDADGYVDINCTGYEIQ